MAISDISIDLTVGIEIGAPSLFDETGRVGSAMIASPSSLPSATVVIGAT